MESPSRHGLSPFRDRLWDRLSPSTLRWWSGLFCTFLGAFMVVAPQEFYGPTYQVLELDPLPWGFAFLLAGGCLLAAVATRPRRILYLTAHLLAAAILGALGTGFVLARGWTGGVFYLVVTAGLLITSTAPPRRPASDRFRGDFLSLVFGVAGSWVGGWLLLDPASFVNPDQPPEPGELQLLGAALLLTLPWLLVVQLRKAPRRLTLWTAHALAGAAMILVAVYLAWPRQAWTGIGLYGGGGLVAALLPWLRQRLRNFDPAALGTRLALAFAAASSLALIATMWLVTAESGQRAQAALLASHQRRALSVARNVVDYIELIAARNASLAAAAGRLAPTADSLGELLVQTAEEHPRISALGAFRIDGTPIARTGRRTILRLWAIHIADALRDADEREPRIEFFRGESGALLLAGSPIYDDRAEPIGVMITAYESQAVLDRLSQEGLSLRLVDAAGRTIASQLPEGAPRDEGATIATAPVPELGWTVVTKLSTGAAAAQSRRERLAAFVLLLVMVLLAIVFGALLARHIARPLQRLADAADRVASGDEWVPLSPSGLSELDRLSANFRQMRDRLAARTRERERLAEELRARADALAEADRRKDEFLAMLAHELRNPLGAISTAAFLLDQMQNDEPRVQRSVAVIRRQMRHLTRLVDDLLDVSRITRGKVELRRGELDLADVVRRAAETAQPLMESSGHSLEVEIADEPLPLYADATRLEQVLGNLLRNAAKYTPSGGHVALSAERQGDEAVLQVRDDGVGIPPELLHRVFELFAQGDQALDRTHGGLGIGLTLVRQLVELHGGSVVARSDGPGTGSEFEIRIPLRHSPAAVLDDTLSGGTPMVEDSTNEVRSGTGG